MKTICPEKYIGQTRTMNCGLKATIIAYRKSTDIDIQFEDGTVRKHVKISNFYDCKIKNIQKLKASDYIGQTKRMNCGLNATIIAYRNSNDIDVRFENGIIRKHVRTDSFNRNGITAIVNYANSYVGLTKTMNNGLKATIIAYRNAKDIDIQFEDGTIRKHISIARFKNNDISKTSRHKITDYIGQTKQMNCGLKATIIAYRKSTDIDIRFENGTIRKHVQISSFNQGTIGETSDIEYCLKHYVGQTKRMNCGLNATIIAYRTYTDIDVSFEDGSIKKHTNITNFNRNHLTHPTNVLFDTYKLNKIAFVFHNKTYFYVTYTENGTEITDIMCVDDMKRNIENLHAPERTHIYERNPHC